MMKIYETIAALLMAQFAHDESRKRSERAKRGWNARRERARHMGEEA